MIYRIPYNMGPMNKQLEFVNALAKEDWKTIEELLVDFPYDYDVYEMVKSKTYLLTGQIYIPVSKEDYFDWKMQNV